jgi:hypothetical protein
MIMGKIIKAVLAGMILVGIILINPWEAGEVSAERQDTKRITKKIELKGEKRLTVRMDIGAGIIDLKKNNTGDILNAEVEYYPKKIIRRKLRST